ncbi:glycine N-acyltransferase-like protein [Saccoglossus kowalevskii]
MAVAVKTEKLTELLARMSQWPPSSYPAYYMIKNSLSTQNEWPSINVYIDNACIPECTTVVVAANKFHHPPLDRTYFMYSTDNDRLKTVFSSPDVVNWDKEIMLFQAVPNCNRQVVTEMYISHGFMSIVINDTVIRMLSNSSVTNTLPPGFTVGPLTPAHAEYVEEKWRTYRPIAPPILAKTFKHRAASAVFDPSGRPVSWAVHTEHGDAGYCYTDPAYRSMGMIKILRQRLKSNVKRGEQFYVMQTVPSRNDESADGNEKLPRASWLLIEKKTALL